MGNPSRRIQQEVFETGKIDPHEAADALVVWLNEARFSPSDRLRRSRGQRPLYADRPPKSYEMAVSLLRDMINIPAALRRADQLSGAARHLETAHISLQTMKVRDELSNYQFAYDAKPICDGSGWRVSLYGVQQPMKLSLPVQYGRRLIRIADAVGLILELAATGELDRIRLCAGCNEVWFRATRRDGKFHTGTCRTAFFSRGPAYREKKRKQMRNYRERLRKKEAAEDRAAIGKPKRSLRKRSSGGSI